MHMHLWIWIALALLIYLLYFGGKRNGAIARAVRTMKAINAVMAAYREGDYETCLQKAEALKNHPDNKAEYCFFRGTMLHHLGRLDEAEASLREGLPLEEDPRQRALVYNTIASVLMDQGRFPEALDHARQAVEIDRTASGMKKEALDSRLGEDLATLAWAVAANSTVAANQGATTEVESLLAESFQLCGTKTKPILAQIYYQAGKAYEALKMPEKAREHFRQAAEVDSKGVYGRLARAAAG